MSIILEENILTNKVGLSPVPSYPIRIKSILKKIMLKNKLNIGILGCGRIFDHYIGKILCSNELINLYKVVAVCDADQKKLREPENHWL